VSWFGAVWYVVNQNQGVSALGLQRVLGLGSYQTAWAWLHKLRRAMVLPGRELLSGAVEVDESYVGARRRGVGGRQLAGKAIVVIAVEGGQTPERVRIRRIPNVKRDTLTDFVLDHVARGSEVRTDAWTGYDDIGRYRFDHVISNVSASGDPAHVALSARASRCLAAEALDPRHPPGRSQPRPARLLPRRVHLPVQPAPRTPSRAAVLPATRGRDRRQTAPL
jgi:transposase-like protein